MLEQAKAVLVHSWHETKSCELLPSEHRRSKQCPRDASQSQHEGKVLLLKLRSNRTRTKAQISKQGQKEIYPNPEYRTQRRMVR